MALDPLALGLPPAFDPNDPFGDAAGGLVDPNAIAPIAAPAQTFMAGGGGGEGGVTVNTAIPEQSSVTVKKRSAPTRAAEMQANETLAGIENVRGALAPVLGEIAGRASELTRAAREEEVAANVGAAKGFQEAEDAHASKLAAVTTAQKAAHDETLKAIQERGQHPFQDKGLVFKLGVALLSGSNSYNNYVMGLDPSASPFARSIRGILDREEAAGVAKLKKSEAYETLLSDQGTKAADTWLANRRATIKDQLAAAVSAAQAKTQGAQSTAEQGVMVNIPVMGDDGRPVWDAANAKPVTEAVPVAVAKERIAAMEKTRLAQSAQLDHLAGYDPTAKIVEKPAAESGALSNKPLTESEAKARTYSQAIAMGAQNVKGKALTPETISRIRVNLRTGEKPGTFVGEWLRAKGISPVPNSMLAGLDGDQKELARNWLNISNARSRYESGSAIGSPEYLSDFDRRLPSEGDGPEQQARLLQESLKLGKTTVPRNLNAQDVLKMYDDIGDVTAGGGGQKFTVQDLQAKKAAIESGASSIRDPERRKKALEILNAEIAKMGGS
jgi:hypothetical protein